jgi:adenine deaminase
MTKRSYQDITRQLVDVAMGRLPADVVIRNGIWVCVQSGEILPSTDVAVKSGRIAYVGPDASHTIDRGTQILEAHGRYLVPGLLDGHMHIESGMLTVTEFVRAVIPHGTTGMFIDPHEIANVFGLRGVRLMVDEAAIQPIHVWVQMPSCVPSAPGLETPGGSITPEDVAEAMSWDAIIGLGEMMNFPAVISGDEAMHAEMAETRLAGKVIGGHYASPDLGLPFHGYVAGGPEDDHEGTRLEDAVMRIRQGMRAMLRMGSSWFDVDDQVRAVTEMRLDPHRIILVTDDCHSNTLVHEGHVNRAVRQAITRGLAPVIAIQMATLNTAEHFGVSRDVGLIAPGRYADILVVSDLANLKIDQVIAKGKLLAENGDVLVDLPAYEYPEWVKNSVNLGRPLEALDFKLPMLTGGEDPPSTITASVIGVIENQAPTRHLRMVMPVIAGEVQIDSSRDIAKVALVERHRGKGEVRVGLVNGFGFDTRCAVGSTVAHDSHHMILAGTDESDMALAANTLADIGGGQIVVSKGEILGQVDLPIAGLMSSERAEVVAKKVGTVLEGFKVCGCRLNNPNMQLSLLPLVVIPELRLSDRGLVDVNNFAIIPVLEG